MSQGHLRREVAARFGDFLEKRGFSESDYFYDRMAFGNELLDLSDADGVGIRFVRDRGQVFADLRKDGADYVPSHLLFARLGVDSSAHARLDEQGLLEPLARDLMLYWDRLIALL